MRFIDTLIIVLISGTFSFSIAEANASKGVKEFLTVLKDECDKYGEPKAYDAVIGKFKDVTSCFQSLAEQLRSERSKARSRVEVDTFVQKYCRENPRFLDCVEDVIGPLKSCVRRNDRKKIASAINFPVRVVEHHFCKDNGHYGAAFIDGGGVECSTSKQQALRNCAERTLGIYVQSPNATYDATDERSCSVLKNFQNCVTEELEGCGGTVPAKLIDALFEDLLKQLSCEKFLDRNATQVPSTDTAKHNLDKEVTQCRWKPYTMQEKCEMNSGPTAHLIVMASADVVPKIADQLTSSRYAGLDVHKVLCYRAPIMEEVVKYFTETVRRCLEPREQEIFRIADNVTSAALRFICENEGERLAPCLTRDGVECFRETSDDLIRCSVEAFGFSNASKSVDQYKLSNLIMSTNRSMILTTKDCNNLETFRNCYVKALAGCNRQIYSQAVNSLFESVENVTTCRDLLRTGDIECKMEEVNRNKCKSDGMFKDTCLKNGGPSAYVVASGGIEYFSRTISNLLEDPRSNNIDKLVLGSTRPKLYCHRAPLFMELVKYFTKSLKPCLEVKELENFDIAENVTSVVLQFMCENEGERLADFIRDMFTPNGTRYWQSTGDDLAQCMSDAFGTSGLPTVNFEQFMRYLRRLVLGVTDCSKLEKFKDCSVRVLAEHDQKHYSGLMKSMLDSVAITMSCNELIQAEAIARVNSTANEQKLSVLGFVAGLIPAADLSNSTLERAEAFLEERCLKNGGSKAYEAAKEVPKILMNQVELLRSKAAELNDRIKRPRMANQSVGVEGCVDISAAKKNVERIAGLIKDCLEPDLHDDVDMMKNLVKSALEYMCEYEGVRIMEFIGIGGIECFNSNQQVIRNCASDFFVSYLPSTGPFIPGVKECTAMNNIGPCIGESIKDCRLMASKDYFVVLINQYMTTLFKATPCNDVCRI